MRRAAVCGVRNSIRSESQAQGAAAGAGAVNRTGGAGRAALPHYEPGDEIL